MHVMYVETHSTPQLDVTLNVAVSFMVVTLSTNMYLFFRFIQHSLWAGVGWDQTAVIGWQETVDCQESGGLE